MTEFLDRQDGRINFFTDAELTRRNFLRTTLLGGAAYVLAACSNGEHEVTPDRFSQTPSWEQDYAHIPDGPVDPAVWNVKLGPENFSGAGQQIYTDKPTNVYVRDGRLVITAFEQMISSKPFTSARIDTLGKQSFGFGRLVVRAQMPSGRGVHPAIWLRRVSKPGENSGIYGEIDLAEFVGHRPDRVFTNLHTNATRQRPDKKGIVTSESQDGAIVPDVSNRMVEYAVDRTADGIAFYADGKQTGRTFTPVAGGKDAWPFAEDDEYYVIANMAIGDRWAGGLEGVDIASDPWQMQVESMRFYPEEK